MSETFSPAGAPDGKLQVGTSAFTQWLAAVMAGYSRNPWDGAVLADLRRARTVLAEFFLDAGEDALKRVFSNQLAKMHLSLAGSSLRDLPLSAEEDSLMHRVLTALGETGAGGKETPGSVLAAMLYCRPDHKPAAFLDRDVPDWLYGVFIAFLAIEPYFFEEQKSFLDYLEFAKKLVSHARTVVADGKKNDATQASPKSLVTALSFVNFSRPVHLYFGKGDLRDISESRAYILEQNARAGGLKLEHAFGAKPAGRRKIRIGILKPHFSGQTETYATLPVFEHLDRDQFDIHLYAVETARTELERYCASRADRWCLLPKSMPEKAQTIRNDAIDILFFGSNLTAGADACTTLALHRLAPVQMTSICCPVTTGFANMDYYVAGDLLAPAGRMQSQFHEKLANIAGSGICFSYGLEPAPAAKNIDRRLLGIPADAVLFISGANFFKITPKVRQTWATIISRVPGAVLLLYPFNPNWSSRYNSEPFIADFNKRFAQLGLADRLKIIQPLPGRSDVKRLLGVADIYLDSFPYGGATSLVDTLEAGLPPVVIKGDALRFRQAASMLEDISMPQLIANDEDSYVELACRLGNDAAWRRQQRDEIKAKMNHRPAFLDSHAYAIKMAELFRSICERHST